MPISQSPESRIPIEDNATAQATDEMTSEDGTLDINLMSDAQVRDHFLTNTFDSNINLDGGELAHFIWGSKPALLDGSEFEHLSRIFNQEEALGEINSKFLSIKRGGNMPYPETIYINKRNFRILVESDPKYFRSKSIFGGQTDPDRMLNHLKSTEPVRVDNELIGVFLGYGVHNAQMWVAERRAAEKGRIASAEQPLPWLDSGIERTDASFNLITPPRYRNWPSKESERLIGNYIRDNREIAQKLLRETKSRSMPAAATQERYYLGEKIAAMALQEIFSPNSWVVRSLASQAHQRSGSGVKFSLFRSLFGQQQHPRKLSRVDESRGVAGTISANESTAAQQQHQKTLRHVTGHIVSGPGATPTLHGSRRGVAGAPLASTRPASQKQTSSLQPKPASEELEQLTRNIGTPATSTGYRRQR
jgi:hypothetical protein